jgi:hypothetical protein
MIQNLCSLPSIPETQLRFSNTPVDNKLDIYNMNIVMRITVDDEWRSFF